MIRITARVEGFRRCGIAHSASPTDYPDDHWTAEKLAVLQAEPMLFVQIIPSNNPRESEKVPAGSPPPPEAQETPAAKGGRSYSEDATPAAAAPPVADDVALDEAKPRPQGSAKSRRRRA